MRHTFIKKIYRPTDGREGAYTSNNSILCNKEATAGVILEKKNYAIDRGVSMILGYRVGLTFSLF